MNNTGVGKEVMWLVLGFVLFVIGIVMIRFQIFFAGFMRMLPYGCVGVGIGIISNKLGTVFTLVAVKSNSNEGRQLRIEQDDERNQTISDKAKARTYDIMIFVYSAMLLSFALMQIEVYVLVTLAVGYLAIVVTNVFFRLKFHKEM